MTSILIGLIWLLCSCVTADVTFNRVNHFKKLINSSVNACDDFYGYACGNYETIHPIPEYAGRLDFLHMVSERNYKMLDGFLTENLKDSFENPNPSAIDKAKIFYASCLNNTALNERGIQPLMELLNKLGGWPVLNSTWSTENFDWLQFLIDVHLAVGENFIIEMETFKDVLYGSGKLLATLNSPKVILREKNLTVYENRIRSTLLKFNVSEDTTNTTTNEIIRFFEELNNASDSTLDSLKVASIADFETYFPGINFTRYLSSIHNFTYQANDTISTFNTPYLKLIPDLFNRTEPKIIINYILWNIVDYFLPALGDNYMDIVHDYNKEGRGYRNDQPRWRTCIEVITDRTVMNTATAVLFTKHVLRNENVLPFVASLTNIIKSTFHHTLLNSSWPAEHIRQLAIEKLDKFNVYFDNFVQNEVLINQEYQAVQINDDKFFESYLNLKRQTSIHAAKRLITQSNETVWPYKLVSADAFHNFFSNKMALHPGLFLSPFYNPHQFPKFLSYGGLGMIIAHELFHGFDNIGASFNSDGILKAWWNESDWEDFLNRTECYQNQYNNYSVFGRSVTEHPLALPEIIADNMALKFAYLTYKNWLENNSVADETVNGLELTPGQLFFISAAQTFCSSIRPEAVAYELLTDYHIPDRYRVMGMFVNSEEFSQEFQCRQSSAMNPIDKCAIF